MFLGEEFKFSIKMKDKQSSGRKSKSSLCLLACKLWESSSVTYLSDYPNTVSHTVIYTRENGPYSWPTDDRGGVCISVYLRSLQGKEI